MHRNDGTAQSFGNFELRKSPTLVTDEHIENKLHDARGGYRGEESGLRLPGNKLILLDAYRPESYRMVETGSWYLKVTNENPSTLPFARS